MVTEDEVGGVSLCTRQDGTIPLLLLLLYMFFNSTTKPPGNVHYPSHFLVQSHPSFFPCTRRLLRLFVPEVGGLSSHTYMYTLVVVDIWCLHSGLTLHSSPSQV